LSDAESEPDPTGFRGLEAEVLLRAGQATALPARTLVCQEGHLINRCFVITAGEVEIVKSIAGKPCILSTVGPGCVLGLMAALDGQPCAVSMRTLGEATVVEITRAGLLAVLAPERASDSNLSHDLALAAVRRLRGATEELAKTLCEALGPSPHSGQMDALRLARIQAENHAWPCATLAA